MQIISLIRGGFVKRREAEQKSEQKNVIRWQLNLFLRMWKMEPVYTAIERR